jgi:hypothetical protein
MNDFVAKISSYDIFNNLVPGAIFAYFLKVLGISEVGTSSILVDVVLYYFLGMIVSRIGSLLVDPLLKFFKIIPAGDYSAFIKASDMDPKILTLLESRNLYRTTLALLLVTLAAYLWQAYLPALGITSRGQTIVMLVCLAVLFLLAYRKQDWFIHQRVEHHKRAE